MGINIHSNTMRNNIIQTQWEINIQAQWGNNTDSKTMENDIIRTQWGNNIHSNTI